MARLSEEMDLFLSVKVQSKANIASKPKDAEVLPTTPTPGTMALGIPLNSASQEPARPLRHKRRFTIGGPKTLPEGKQNHVTEKPPEAPPEHIKPKSTVTISRSHSRLQSGPSRNPGSRLGDDIAPMHQPIRNEQERPSFQRSSTVPTTQDVTVDHCVSRGSSIRSRSPDKAQYPPSSWKTPQKPEPATNTMAGSDGMHQNTPNAADVCQRPKLGQPRHTEPALARPIKNQKFAGLLSSESSQSRRRSSSATPRIDDRSPSSNETANTFAHAQPMYIRSRRRNSLVSPQIGETHMRRDQSVIDTGRNVGTPSANKHDLPEPEIAYAHTYHYTTCEHTSPPLSRPLNVQPTPVQYREGLLAYPPFQLRNLLNSPKVSIPSIYVIDGSCCNCDLSERREAESGVLDKYTTRLDNLFLQLNLLQDDMDTKASSASGSLQSEAISSSPDVSPETIQSIVLMEHQLDDLVQRRDREVKSIWKGYTARWGPATLAIHHENDSIGGRGRTQSISQRNTTGADLWTNSSVSDVDTVAGRTSTIVSTASSRTTHTLFSGAGRPKLNPSRQTSFTTSVNGPQERYSDGTRPVTATSSVDGVRGDGRMMVEWIRPERGNARSRSQSQSQSRRRSSMNRTWRHDDSLS